MIKFVYICFKIRLEESEKLCKVARLFEILLFMHFNGKSAFRHFFGIPFSIKSDTEHVDKQLNTVD